MKSLRLLLLLLFAATTLPAKGDGFAPKGETAGAEEMPNIDIVNKIGNRMPTETTLRDEKDQPITLAEAMNGKPTVLIFAYYRCPQLCNQVLTHLVDELRRLPGDLSLGKQFNAITISIDPKDTPLMAWSWRKNYIELYGRDGAEAGWRFLTTKEPQIDLLTEAAGFKYEVVERPVLQTGRSERKNKDYYHPAVAIVLQPDGTISRYLFGLGWKDKDLKFALIDSNGDLGDFKDKMVLRCFMSYDATKGRYTMDVWRLTRTIGVFTLLLIAAFVTRSVIRDRRRRASAPMPTAG